MECRSRMSRGFLISIEGIDGTGKTTQVHLLKEWFERKGKAVIALKEPTQGRYGREIAKLAQSGKLDDLEKEVRLFMMDRREDVEENILPALEAGKVVIMDRYYHSNMAYQGARGLRPEKIKEANEEFSPRPDLIIVLDFDPSKCMQRVFARKNIVKHFENEAYLKKVRQIFLEIGKAPNAVVISTDRPIEEVHRSIIGSIEKKLPQALY